MMKSLKQSGTQQRLKSTNFRQFNQYLLLIGLSLLAIYFLLFSFGWMQCGFKLQTGYECTTCGITRDLLNFANGDFSKPLNPNSRFVATFGLFQMSLRIIFSLVTLDSKWIKFIVIGDSTLIILFLLKLNI